MIQFLYNNKEVIQLILNGIQVLVIPIVAFILTQAFTKRSKAEENLNETKRRAFEELMIFFKDYLRYYSDYIEACFENNKNYVPTKQQSQFDNRCTKLTERMSDVENKLLLFANPKIISTYIFIFKHKHEDSANDYHDIIRKLDEINNLFKLLREEFGIDNPKNDDLLKVIFPDIENMRKDFEAPKKGLKTK